MVHNQRLYFAAAQQSEEDMDIRKGPWTDEEDAALVNYIAIHGEGRWNSLARCAGLKRTGKSCRLRWLNYLRPDVRRGNITLQEQLMILELHSRWGNRWSKIAQYLPGRTDNEIKNYWRTRVQKQAKQLKCDVNSKQFRDTLRYVWMPRLVERIRASSKTSTTTTTAAAATITATATDSVTTTYAQVVCDQTSMAKGHALYMGSENNLVGPKRVDPDFKPEMSGCSSDSLETQVSQISDLTDCCDITGTKFRDGPRYCPALETGPNNINHGQGLDLQDFEQSNAWLGCGDSLENLLNDEDIWFLRQQLGDEV